MRKSFLVFDMLRFGKYGLYAFFLKWRIEHLGSFSRYVTVLEIWLICFFLGLCLFKVKRDARENGGGFNVASGREVFFGGFCELFCRCCVENSGLLWRKEKSLNV